MIKDPIFSFERYEKKYFITDEQKDKLLYSLKGELSPDAYGKYTVCNIYYDTDDWQVVSASCEKPDYKEKLRVRSYGVPDPGDSVFIELKKKCSGIVYKRRVTAKTDYIPDLLGKYDLCGTQIENEIMWFQKMHRTSPHAFIGYDRTALAGKNGLRITFDRNMRFRTDNLDLTSGDSGKSLISGDPMLMEVKFTGACPLKLSHILSDLGIYPVSFSKYGTFYKTKVLKGGTVNV